MRQMLSDRIVVNIDDQWHVNGPDDRVDDAVYLPRKMNRCNRLLRSVGLTNQSDAQYRSEWMHRTISASGASLVFAHFLNAATEFSQVWRQLGLPVVVHCHGYDVGWDFRHHETKERLHPVDYKERVESLSENVWFVANSTATEQRLLAIGINPEKIFLKRFGVPLAPSPKASVDRDPNRILFLGRLVDFKGPLETVEAFSKIAKKHSNAILQIAGGGHLMDDMKRRIKRLGIQDQVQCLGPVTPAKGDELRQRAAIFTAHNQTGSITGQDEAFGVSMLEAMGYGIPVVTGRSGGLVDFVKHQQTGLLFEPGDVDAHAEHLDELLSSKQRREALGTAAWQLVRDQYQIQHERQDLNRIFQHAAARGKAPTLKPLRLRKSA